MLDAPEPGRASAEAKPAAFKRKAPVTEMPLRRDAIQEYGESEAEFAVRPRRTGVRVSFSGGLLPKTLWGRIAAGCGFLVLAAATIAAGVTIRSFLLHDEHFVVPTSDAIQIGGNSHLTRAQLLSVFGGDVDRNIFDIPLVARQAELESLPWVAHATVMRLLPNRVRVSIVERTPVAFVRQGAQIGLVDANGVLFDLPGPDAGSNAHDTPHYSFPVLTGIAASDPLSTRAARMRIYLGFMAALDSAGESISRKVSEVDVSNPEDVKAILPDSGSDILVHFGEEKFLERYHAYQQHLAEWRAQYPKLASVDMRYEQQVVLEMQPGSGVPTGDSAPAASAADTTHAEPAGTPKPAAAAKPGASHKPAAKKPAAKKPRLKARPAGSASQGATR